MTTGGAYSIHTKNIFSDLQVDMFVRLKTDSTRACDICRHVDFYLLRHVHKKELFLVDQVAVKNVEVGRVSSEDHDEEVCDENGNDLCRGFGWRTVACGFG